MRFYLFIFLLFLPLVKLLSQNKGIRPEYKLLWKIEGRDLAKPSYLFGTMHLYDNRVYDFSDSVLIKLKECKAFATETHPDSVIKLVFKWIFENSSENEFKKTLNKKEYDELDSLVKLRSGYTLAKLKNPVFARMLLEKKIGARDKSTFLDAYLYSTAKSMGKRVLGLEKASDQLSLFSYTAQNLKAMLINKEDQDAFQTKGEEMITLYQRGDIDEIYRFMKRATENKPEYFKKLLTDRNKIMVASIEKEIRNQSIFIAVGAAHLGGQDGIVELLKADGYQLTVVNPSFTGLAKKFKVEKQEGEWETFNNVKGSYSVQMPTAPITFKIDSLGITLNASIELGGLGFFQTTHLFIDSELRDKSPHSIADKFEQRMRSRFGKLEQVRHFQVAGYDALEFSHTNHKGTYYRNQFVIRDPFIYMMQAGPSKEAAHSPEADRFFSSIKIGALKEEQWAEFTDAPGAFSVKLYGKPKTITNRVKLGSSLQPIYAFLSEDINQKKSYLIRYNDLPPGSISENDSSYYVAMAEDLRDRMKGTNLRYNNIKIDGYPAVEFTFDINGENIVKAREVFRGPRFYLLLATANSKTENSGADQVFNSFHFIDFTSKSSTEYTLDKNLKIALPSSPTYDSTSSTDERKIYYSVDPSSGVQFLVDIKQLDQYEYYESIDAFFSKQHEQSDGDSIISKTKITGTNSFGQEIEISSPRVNGIKKVRTIVSGRTIFEFTAFMPQEHLRIPSTITFFNSIKIPEALNPWSLTTRKTDQFLLDLKSIDTTVFFPAKSKLYSYKFTSDEIPKLYTAIQQNYASDTAKYPNVKRSLIMKLVDVNDSTTPEFLKKIYPSLPPSSFMRSVVYNVLSYNHTELATKTFIELLKSEKDLKLEGSIVFDGFADSLELTAQVLPELYEHKNSFDNNWNLYYITRSVLQKDSADIKSVERISQLLADAASYELKKRSFLPEDHEDYYYTKLTFEAIAAALSSAHVKKETLDLLQALSDVGYTSVSAIAIPHLAKHGVKVDAKKVEKVAADPLNRLTLYNNLKKNRNEKLFPKAFLNQEKFAEGALLEYMQEDEGMPGKIEFVEVKQIEFEKQKQKLFVFRYKWEESDEWNIALSGPYKLKELTSSQEFTYNTYVTYNKSDLNEALSKILQERNAKLLK